MLISDTLTVQPAISMVPTTLVAISEMIHMTPTSVTLLLTVLLFISSHRFTDMKFSIFL